MKRERPVLNDDGSKGASTLKTSVILIATIGGAMAALAAFLWYVTPDTGDTIVSGHGTVAMILGVVFSLVVGMGLMGLVFYSSRRGYDDGVARRREEPSGPTGGPDAGLDDR